MSANCSKPFPSRRSIGFTPKNLRLACRQIAGGLSLAFARTFKIIDPQIKHLAAEKGNRAFQIFDLLL
jgi:hypothetical protein